MEAGFIINFLIIFKTYPFSKREILNALNASYTKLVKVFILCYISKCAKLI